MSYQYIAFDDVPLPLYNHAQEHGSMQSDSALVDSIGNVYDYRGDLRQRGRRQLITLNGLYAGEETYFSDDGTGTSGGDTLIWGDNQQSLRAAVSGLMGKRGQRGPLWRRRLNDGTLEWKTARLLQVSWPRKWDDHGLLAELSCRFETAMDGWRAETQTERTKNLSADGFEYVWVVEVDTELTIDDAVITITRGSGSITSVYITCADLGIDLEFTGLATATGSLIIDCGAQTMRHSNGTDIYSYFARGAGHTARGWCPLPPGTHQFNVTVNGGTATATIAFYPQMA